MTETLTLKVEIDPKSQEDIKDLCDKMKDATKNFPRHPINLDNSRLIAILSRIEALEVEVRKLRGDISHMENFDIEDLEDRISALEYRNG